MILIVDPDNVHFDNRTSRLTPERGPHNIIIIYVVWGRISRWQAGGQALISPPWLGPGPIW